MKKLILLLCTALASCATTGAAKPQLAVDDTGADGLPGCSIIISHIDAKGITCVVRRHCGPAYPDSQKCIQDELLERGDHALGIGGSI